MQTVIRVEKLSKTFNHNKALHAVDLTVQQGEMVADYHSWYGSAATMLTGELHEKLVRPTP